MIREAVVEALKEVPAEPRFGPVVDRARNRSPLDAPNITRAPRRYPIVCPMRIRLPSGSTTANSRIPHGLSSRAS